ncbi:MAG: STAS domain-containing protein [Phycisphaerales bacterium JB039]
MALEIDERRHGAVTVVRPAGSISGDDAAALLERICDAAGRSLGRIVIDAGAVPFVDSAGLEALLDAADRMAESGQSLKLCSVNETLREVLALTGLARRFEQYEDVQSAVRSFL